MYQDSTIQWIIYIIYQEYNMANLNGKLGQVPGSTAVINTEVYTYFALMAEALKRDKGIELKVEQSYLSKFEVVDELRKTAKNKTPNNPTIASMLDVKVKMEDILGVKAASALPSGSAAPAQSGSTAAPPTFPADSYEKLTKYLGTLKRGDFDPPLYNEFRSSQEEFNVFPFPNWEGFDPRQTGNLVVIGPKQNIKPDILDWIYNNSILYGFLPYGNPQTQGLYFVGVESLKKKVKVVESVVRVVSMFLQQQLSPSIVTTTTEKVITNSLTGGTEFQNPGNLDYAIEKVPDNSKKLIQLVLIPGEGDHLVREDVATAYVAMKAAAKKEGVDLKIGSAFRPPFALNGPVKTKAGKSLNPTTQFSIRKSRKPDKNEDFWLNASANSYNPAVAPPGSSNHGSGIALDLNTGGYPSYPGNALVAGGRNYEWLAKNAHRFGFIRGVSSEAWHWEYYPPNKPSKSGKNSSQGPFAIVSKTSPTWGSYANVDWQGAGPFAGTLTA